MTGTLKAMKPVTVAPTSPRTMSLIRSMIPPPPMGLLSLMTMLGPLLDGCCCGFRVVRKVVMVVLRVVLGVVVLVRVDMELPPADERSKELRPTQ